MKIAELTKCELKRALRATERAAGVSSVEVKILRRELVRREEMEKHHANKAS